MAFRFCLYLMLCLPFTSVFSENTQYEEGMTHIEKGWKDHDHHYDLGGDYVSLDHVSIRVSGAEDVTLDMEGSYPVLEWIRVEGWGGESYLKLTGDFPSLARVDCSSVSGDVILDLQGEWDKDATVIVRAASGSIRVHLPDNVSVRVETHVDRGRVQNEAVLEEENFSWFGLRSKRVLYRNHHLDDAPTIKVIIETQSGDVYLSY